MSRDYKQLYPSFAFDRPREGVLRITFDGPGLNAVSPDAHRERYRAAAPIFDASLGYEFYGFGGPDAAEGLASHRDKRDPMFSGPTSE
jgi:hypothetical protein